MACISSSILSNIQCQSPYQLTLSISLVTRAENAKMLQEKVAITKSFMNLSEQERQDLMNTVGDVAELKDVEYYKS
jgi:hypothetical protein